MTTMTPDQFFDALDELFGTDDGYVHHLKRIIDNKHLMEHMEESWLSEEDVSAQVDPLYEEIKTVKKNAMKQVHKLNKQNKELKHELMMQEGRYDFLKETSIDKTMDTQSTDDIIKLEKENKEFKDGEMQQILLKEQEVTKRIHLEKEIKELKSKLEASREVSTCYAKVISQSPERKLEEAIKNLVISPESASYVASMIP